MSEVLNRTLTYTHKYTLIYIKTDAARARAHTHTHTHTHAHTHMYKFCFSCMTLSTELSNQKKALIVCTYTHQTMYVHSRVPSHANTRDCMHTLLTLHGVLLSSFHADIHIHAYLHSLCLHMHAYYAFTCTLRLIYWTRCSLPYVYQQQACHCV